MTTKGKLYIVPTPIGNLEDITIRAIRILKESDLILAEDTRTSSILLNNLKIETKMKSYHKFNEHNVINSILEKLKSGLNISIISDAGTPGISDPGFLIVRESLKNNIDIECLPGATAFVPALVCSGFPSDRFCFEGFLPHKKGRQTRLKELSLETRTIVLYESPHRILKTLNQLREYFGEDRQISLSREISKKFEETKRGNIVELINYFNTNDPKGEFVIVIKGRE